MQGLRHLWPYVLRHRWSIALGLAALVGVDFLQLYLPRIIKWAVDDLTLARASAASLLGQAGQVLALAAGIVLLRLLWRPLLFGFSRRVERDLRQRIFDHTLGLQVDYLRSMPPGQIMARATDDLNNIRMASGIGLVAAIDGLVLGTAAIGFMLYINPLLTALAVLPMPLIGVASRFLSPRIYRDHMSVQAAFSAITELVREVLGGMRITLAYALAPAQDRALARLGRGYLQANMGLARAWGLLMPLTRLVTNLALAILLGGGGVMTVLGLISPGDFVAFTAYLMMLTWPMMALGWVLSLMQRAGASLNRVQQVLGAEPAISDPPSPRPLPATAKQGIALKDLTFAYPGGSAAVLSGVSLSIGASTTAALVGRIGCGKSTVLRLLGRLYDPPPGAVFVEGVDVRELAQAELRAHVVQVPQEAFLFSARVRDNLALGLPGASEDQMWAALRAAQLEREVAALPAGLDTKLGERAHILSGGQRQRLALARALLLDPAVLLLDDPLSAVDTQTEAAILANLAALRGRRTTVMVSHRLASVAFAQQIYVLDQGRLVEAGSHQELLAAGGIYQALFAEQALLASLQEEG